jgi:YggT family protein
MFSPFAWLADVLSMVIQAYIWIIIIRALLSWVNPDPYNPIVRFLSRVTEPVLRQVRYRMPDLGGLDLSPMVVIFALILIDRYLVAALRAMAYDLR